MTKYLLSTGLSTTKIELYIMDLFVLHMKINPGDIPHASDIGFDFIMTNTTKDTLIDDVKFRVKSLIKKIKEKLNSLVVIEIVSLDIINEETARLVISVNNIESEIYTINLK